MQSYDDILSFIIYVITPDSGYDQNVLYRLSDEELENFYSTYEENIQKWFSLTEKLKAARVLEKKVRRDRNAA